MKLIYPFKILDSYTEEDHSIFFGRDDEINSLYKMVSESNVVILYGASGTGKTSLIQSGLSKKFKPHQWLPIFIRRKGNINESLFEALNEVLRSRDSSEQIPDTKNKTDNKNFNELFRNIYLKHFKPVYLIFDQFEELFTSEKNSVNDKNIEQETFYKNFAEILKVKSPVETIFSIREEYLGFFDKFEKIIPDLTKKRLRVEPMNHVKVIEVIKNAASYEDEDKDEKSNVSLEAGKENEIIDLIFEILKGNKRTLTVELPHLQVLLDKLYIDTVHDEGREKEAVITLQTVKNAGEIDDVLRNFLEEQVKKISDELIKKDYTSATPNNIWEILSPFASENGTKTQVPVKDLPKQISGFEPEAKLIPEVIDKLFKRHILKFVNDDVYEITHDSLALRIAEKQSAEKNTLREASRFIKDIASLTGKKRTYFTRGQLEYIKEYEIKLNLNENEKELIKQSRRKIQRRWIYTIAGISIFVLTLIGLTSWALNKEREVSINNEELSKRNADLFIEKNKSDRLLNNLKMEQALSFAKDQQNSAESFYNFGDKERAKKRFQIGLDTLIKNKTDTSNEIYKSLKDGLDKCGQ